MRNLTDDYYEHKISDHALIGKSTNTTIRLGDRVEVQLQDVDPMTGSIIFDLLMDGRSDFHGIHKSRKSTGPMYTSRRKRKLGK